MRPLVGIAISHHDFNHGLSADLAANYADAFHRLGYDTEILAIDVTNSASLQQLLRPQFRLLVCHGGWALMPLGSEIRAAAQRAHTPLLALIADPPYANWIGPMTPAFSLAMTWRRAALFFIDPSFAYGIGHWLIGRSYAAYLPCGYHNSPPPLPVEDRQIRALFAGHYYIPDSITAVARQNPVAFPLYAALIEEALFDYTTPLLFHAQRLAPGVGVPPDIDNNDFRSALQWADTYVRGRRRGLLLRRLLRLPVHIVTNLLPPVADRHPNAVVVPAVSHGKLLELMRASRVLVVCQPHFPGALNERIIAGMQAGSVVITTPNPRTQQLFTHARELWCLKPDFSNLEDLIDITHDNAVLRRTQTYAREAISGCYTPDGNLRYMLGIMRDRGLLESDLPVPAGQTMELPTAPTWK